MASRTFLEDKGITSDQLMDALHEILDDADLTKTTGKHVRLQLESKFGLEVDSLVEHKKQLNELLNDILSEISAVQASKQKPKPIKRAAKPAGGKKKKKKGDDSESAVSDESEYGESESEQSDQSEQSGDESEDSDDYKPQRKSKPAKQSKKQTAKRKKRSSDSDDDDDSDGSYGGSRKRRTATRTTKKPNRRVNTHLTKLKRLAAIHHVSLIRPKNVARMDEDEAIDYLEALFDEREIDYSDLSVSGMEAAQLRDELKTLDGNVSEEDEEDQVSDQPTRGRRALRARKPVKYEDDGQDLSDTQFDDELKQIYGDELFVKPLTAEEKAAKAAEAEIKKAAAQAAREARLKIKLEKEAEAAKNRPPEPEDDGEQDDEEQDEDDEEGDEEQENGADEAQGEEEGEEEEQAPKPSARRRKRIDDSESENYEPDESDDD